MSMMRFASEEDFEKFKRATGVREARPLVTKAAAPVLSASPAIPSGPARKRVAGGDEIAGRTPAAAAPKESDIERRFDQQVRSAGLPTPERNWFHIPGRNFSLDFAWPDRKIAVEIQGHAHRIRSKFAADIEKRALAMLLGWRVMELSGDAVRSEQGIKWLVELWGQHE